MGACASKTNDNIDETNIEPEVFTSPMHDAVAEYDIPADEVVDGMLPQTAKTDQYEVVDHPAGNVDPISHLDGDYQNQGFMVTENPVTHIMVREGVYMNKTTNEILYDTAVFPNGADEVAQPMDPVPSRGHEVDAYNPIPDTHYPAQPITYDHNYPEQASFAPEQAAPYAPQHEAAPQENNLMVGVAMAQDQEAAAPQLDEPQPEAEVSFPEADQQEAQAPVAESKKRRKRKKSKKRGWGW